MAKMVAKKKKRKKKASTSRKCYIAFQKVFGIVFFIVVVINLLMYVTIKAHEMLVSLENKTKSVIHNQITDEQKKHYLEAREIVKDSEEGFWSIEEFALLLEKEKTLTVEQKIDLAIELKTAEENSFRLGRFFDEYFDDQTIVYYSYASEEVTSYVYEMSLLKLAVDRFVRSSEFLLYSQTFGKSQKSMLIENYYDVMWQFGHLKEIGNNIE